MGKHTMFYGQKWGWTPQCYITNIKRYITNKAMLLYN